MTEKRKFVISDLHGCADDLERAIDYINSLEKNATIIFLGDYLDRGRNAWKTITMVKEYVENNKGSIALLGNHDQMFLDFINKGDPLWPLNDRKGLSFKSLLGADGIPYFKDGQYFYNIVEGRECSSDVRYLIKKRNKGIIEWMESLPLFAEDENNIFVHAGIDFWDKDWRKNTTKETMIWAYPPELYKENVTGKTIVCGHVQAAEIWGKQHNYYEGIFYNKKTNTFFIDGSTPTSKTVNILEIVENKTYVEHNCI